MHWVVAAPYFGSAEDRWISDAVPPGRHRFTLVPRLGRDRNWHQASARAGLAEWRDRARQANKAVGTDSHGLITVFPQLAAMVGGLQRARRDQRPLVAWMFNTEGLGPRHRRQGARLALAQVDRFVVHATAEIDAYSRLLDLPPERFSFVPLQYGAAVETAEPAGQDEPYVFATGSGCRDYGTFFTAVEKLGYRTLVLASDRVLDGLSVPGNVEVLDQLPRPEIRRLVRHAAVNVVPLTTAGTTAGLVTIVETFRHGRSLVVTRRPGLEDYCIDGVNVLGAKIGDAVEMAEAIDRMWSEPAERDRLDGAAAAFGETNCTDRAAGHHLVALLDSFAGQPIA